MTNLHEIPFAERTYEQVRESYHEQFPLLAMADEVIASCNASDSIHRPAGGLDAREVTRRALVFVGLRARCQADIDHAAAFIERLRDEMPHLYPPSPPNLADAVIGVEYSWAGCVTAPDDFADLTAEQRAEHVQSLADEICEHTAPDRLQVLFAQALALALPAVYAEISAADDVRRQWGVVVTPPEVS